MTNKQSKRILKVVVKRMIDESPDTSFLGEYSNHPKTEYTVDRQELGDMGRGEFRYFNGCVENYEGEDSTDIRKYIRQDYDRMEALQRGDWAFIGVSAEAEVWNPKSQVVQQIQSGGLWGIESDSEKGYIESEQKNQLAELRDELLAYGFSRRAVAQAFKNVKQEVQ